MKKENIKNRKGNYDVFISYRREDGWESAKHLRDLLVAKGYSVFFDIDSLKNGNFNDAILEYIKNCKDFIIILSPRSLNRCVNEGDWVRKELACALEAKKNIIPVMYENFTFPNDLPKDIEGIKHINGIKVYMEVFDAIVERIISFMESKPKPLWKRVLSIVGIILVIAALAGAGGYFAWQKTERKGTDKLPAATEQPIITEAPTLAPTVEPTTAPTAEPTAALTAVPTVEPTAEPTAVPTPEPTAEPTPVPTEAPTAAPTDEPAVSEQAVQSDSVFTKADAIQGSRVLMADTISTVDTYNVIFKARDLPAFKGSVIRGEVSSITFLDTMSGIPADAWDVSEDADGSVMAWTTENEGLYDLYIAAEGGVIAPESCWGLFCGYEKLEKISFNNAFNTENTTRMAFMFSNLWRVQELDLSQFNTGKVTQMEGMFHNCAKIEKLDLSSFDTSNVIYMGDMFKGATSLTEVNLSSFNTAKVWGMDRMFSSCRSLTEVDLSSFDLSAANYFKDMFKGCSQLKTLYLGKLAGNINITADEMFSSCDALTDIYYGGTEEEWKGTSVSAEVPAGVQVHYTERPAENAAVPKKTSISYESAASQALIALEEELNKYFHTVYVYNDFSDYENHFTQRMLIAGKDASLVHGLEENWQTNPYSGSSCIRCEIVTKQNEWGGWLFVNGYIPEGGGEPQINKADAPDQGMNLKGAEELRFWARGEKGGEKVQFQTGGFQYESGAAYPDSCAAQILFDIELDTEWKEYVIDLRDADTSYLICGFGFVMAGSEEETENVFYLDDIRFVGDFPDAHPLMRSYDSENDYLKNTAFSYDNAVAAMAFMSAGKQYYAKDILDSFVYAIEHDRYQSGRVRNAYVAGDITCIPGWGDSARLPISYNANTQSWQEHQHHTGSDTGNTSYVALALLQYHALYGGEEYLNAAKQLMDWVIAECGSAMPGFTAGYDGWPENGSNTTYLLTYKSIEHNIDAYAAFNRLAKLTDEQKYIDAADSALQFVLSMYDQEQGVFYTGTLSDGVTVSKENTVLDAQVWACLALGEQFAPYEAVLRKVEAMKIKQGGYSFCRSNENSGWWAEGTAFTALMYRLRGDDEKADAALNALCGIQLESGLFPAATVKNLSTGIYLYDGTAWEYGNESHIAPAAWFVMAVNQFNPYAFQ